MTRIGISSPMAQMKKSPMKSITLKSVFVLVCLMQAPLQASSVVIGPDSLPSRDAASSGIGPAPAQSTQKKLLARALSPDVRRTLQDAINSGN